MKTILISNEAMDAIRSAADQSFKQTAKRVPPNWWRLSLADETFEQLLDRRLEDESWSDTIIRVISTSKGGTQ